MHEPSALRLYDNLERGVCELRKHFNGHRVWEAILSALDDLISDARKLKAERGTLTASLAAQTARADKAESDFTALQAERDADEKKAADAAAELEAEIAAEGDTSGHTGDETLTGNASIS